MTFAISDISTDSNESTHSYQSSSHQSLTSSSSSSETKKIPEPKLIGDKIIRELSVHIFCEEQVLYPAMRNANLGSEADKSLEEHLVLKNTLYELDQMPFNDKYILKMAELIREVQEHVNNEETVTLPAFERVATGDMLMSLGKQFSDTKASAPTRPHPSAPNKPPMSTFAAATTRPIDKLKDSLSGRNHEEVQNK